MMMRRQKVSLRGLWQGRREAEARREWKEGRESGGGGVGEKARVRKAS